MKNIFSLSLLMSLFSIAMATELDISTAKDTIHKLIGEGIKSGLTKDSINDNEWCTISVNYKYQDRIVISYKDYKGKFASKTLFGLKNKNSIVQESSISNKNISKYTFENILPNQKTSYLGIKLLPGNFISIRLVDDSAYDKRFDRTCDNAPQRIENFDWDWRLTFWMY